MGQCENSEHAHQSKAQAEEASGRQARAAPGWTAVAVDAAKFSPVKAISGLLARSGVDPDDQAAVNAWVEEVGSLPDEQLEEILGALIPSKDE